MEVYKKREKSARGMVPGSIWAMSGATLSGATIFVMTVCRWPKLAHRVRVFGSGKTPNCVLLCGRNLRHLG